MFISTYTSALTSANPFYTRPNGLFGSHYYYESIDVNIPSTGIYRFQSDNKLDTYASVYSNNFIASNPSANLFYQMDDQSEINWNFQFALNIPYAVRITIVITTFKPNTQGSYTLHVTGPNKVTFLSTTK